VANAFISYFNTNNAYQVIEYNTALQCLSKKSFSLAGFEPGSTVSEVDAMSTVSRHQGNP
jgi:hypothetical protein